MNGVKVYDILGKPVLTSRQSARRINEVLSGLGRSDGKTVKLDFSGTSGVSPSFIDEALRVAEDYIGASGKHNATVIFAHPPIELSSSHHAIARAHGRTLVETEDGDWEFRKK